MDTRKEAQLVAVSTSDGHVKGSDNDGGGVKYGSPAPGLLGLIIHGSTPGKKQRLRQQACLSRSRASWPYDPHIDTQKEAAAAAVSMAVRSRGF